jgi:hypothetical protein
MSGLEVLNRYICKKSNLESIFTAEDNRDKISFFLRSKLNKFENSRLAIPEKFQLEIRLVGVPILCNKSVLFLESKSRTSSSKFSASFMAPTEDQILGIEK